jgi:hypothetical protein
MQWIATSPARRAGELGFSGFFAPPKILNSLFIANSSEMKIDNCVIPVVQRLVNGAIAS